ncbi:uncharacterized protein APUU_70844S [Aspergillus puulaauensis]|uniref:Deoxyribonuclease NucA/NucB domain-containing protein n=1 Tax=Aspergillus puulaauensis TaxID=1220207 RepID=A0A7R8ARF2_9EURO|nr:uncharacterized protein APUU_70844S [Aspergillus puulaauensis]BCS29274.1 hypothetical protein APUU_70844S [Aspergillus puulaauensis]
MKLLQLFSCAWLALLVSAAIYTGPQTTEMEDGVEVWKTKISDDSPTLTHRVNDLQTRNARPKIVFNCAIVPALCNNARSKLGDGSTATMHYDADWVKVRKNARRAFPCPNTWDTTHTCPESNQPSEFWFTDKGKSNLKKKEIKMWKGKHGDESPDNTQLAQLTRITHDDDGKPIEQWSKVGAKLTCDEWPAASWIEGGQGANSYCAPGRAKCPQGGKLNTEQDFQSSVYGQVINWYNKFYDQWPVNDSWTDNKDIKHDLNYQIFKFDIELVSDGDDKYATWLEANGRKRYCFPKSDGAGCKTSWDEDPDDYFGQKA